VIGALVVAALGGDGGGLIQIVYLDHFGIGIGAMKTALASRDASE